MEELSSQTKGVFQRNRKLSDAEDDNDSELEFSPAISTGNKVLICAFLVTGVALAMPKMLGTPPVGNVSSEVCCGVQLPSDFLSVVVLLCQSLPITTMNSKNITEIKPNSSNSLSFPDCQKLILTECGVDITNTSEISHIASCLAKGWVAMKIQETGPILEMLETMSRKKMETMKQIPYHHRQERPRLSPSAGFNDLAMEERGRMGAHPASNSMFHQAETVRSRQPAPGISRMPPIPMKLNMNMGGQSAPPAAAKPGGSLALITPVYAVGIMVFFVFTLWKIFFKEKEVEEDGVEEDATTCAADIKWEDMTSRISKIGNIVEKIVDDDLKSDEDLKDEDENSKSKTVVETPLPESEESKERDLGSTGRISCCHRNRADNCEDEFDPSKILLKDIVSVFSNQKEMLKSAC